MNLTVEAIEALRQQGVSAEALLDALTAALKAKIEKVREQARLRQQRSRERRRPRQSTVHSEPCHAGHSDPSPEKEKVPPHPPKRKTNPIHPKPPSSASATAEAAEGTRLPDDWSPTEAHVQQAEMACHHALDPQIATEFAHLDQCANFVAVSVEMFALQFVEGQVERFRGWANTWRRTHVDWDARFSEWLRIEFAKLAKARKPIRTICEEEFGPVVRSLDDSVWHQMSRIKALERRGATG